MSIVTKKGDSGRTGLATGGRVSKADPRMEAVGQLDELNSFLGLARALVKDRAIAGHIKKIQKELFLLGTEFVAECPAIGRPTSVGKEIGYAHLKEIEKLITKYESVLKKRGGFAIPGDSVQSAALDVVRTVCRRLERRIVALKDSGKFRNDEALAYINRLSDLLWTFARKIEARL